MRQADIDAAVSAAMRFTSILRQSSPEMDQFHCSCKKITLIGTGHWTSGFWHFSDLPTSLTNIGYQGKSGSNSDIAKSTRLTPMYGPAVRCKKISSNWRRRSCINVSGL